MKPFRRKRLGKKAAKRAQKAARHLPPALAHAAFSLASNTRKNGRVGKLGPASEGRNLSAKERDDVRAQYETSGKDAKS
jgi:hypothetical protein